MNNEAMLFRQVHPTFVQDDLPTSQVYNPSVQHGYILSNYSGDHFSAKSSFEHYTANGNSACGTIGVTNQEVLNVGLTAILDDIGFAGHVSVSMKEYEPADRKKISKILRNAAVAKGWLHRV